MNFKSLTGTRLLMTTHMTVNPRGVACMILQHKLWLMYNNIQHNILDDPTECRVDINT